MSQRFLSGVAAPFAAPLSVRARATLWAKLPPLIALLGLWLLVRPYAGISGDAILYVGKALAHLDPAGVGRDIIFSHDRQMQFSVFPLLLGGAVHLFGLSQAAEVVAFSAAVLWFFAAVVFAFHLAEARARWIILLFIFLAPATYANGFRFGEALAVPRPFAEALVLLASAAILREKRVLAGVLLVGAALLHPIMALPGFGLLFLNLLHRDKRWLLLALLVLPVFGVAEVLQVPLLGRLFVTLDSKWWAILEQCNSNILPLLWNPYAFSLLAVQATTLLVAIWSLEQRYRAFFLHVLLVAFGGLTIAVLFGDLVQDELVVQAQLWRALWLAAVLAPAALALLLVQAKAKAPQDWIVPTLIATAWLPTSGAARFLLCGSALVLQGLPHAKQKIPEFYALWTVRFVLLFGVVNLLANDARYAYNLDTMTIVSDNWHYIVLKLNMICWLLALCLFFIVLGTKIKVSPIVRYAMAFGFLLVGLRFWDGRAFYRKQLDAARPLAAFAAIIATRPGPVYWVGGANEAWFWLRRANWFSNLQSWPVVFSRQQAVQWKARAERVVQLGLEPPTILHSHAASTSMEGLPRLTASKVAAFCAASDAPPWIVWPVAEFDSLTAEGIVPRAIWQMAPRDVLFLRMDDATALRPVKAFALLDCPIKTT